MVQEDGTTIERTRGTPQGGVVSPILANIFMHYAFDLWMVRTHPVLPWCRYAGDGLVHCRNEQEAQVLKTELHARLAELPLRDASDENQDRLLQRPKAQRHISKRQV